MSDDPPDVRAELKQLSVLWCVGWALWCRPPHLRACILRSWLGLHCRVAHRQRVRLAAAIQQQRTLRLRLHTLGAALRIETRVCLGAAIRPRHRGLTRRLSEHPHAGPLLFLFLRLGRLRG